MSEQNFFTDSPAQSDALGRSQFATALAGALLTVNSIDGFVVGIEGGWGTGKSSVIGFTKSSLSQITSGDSKPIVIDFNPWLVSNTGALVEALVAQIASAINADLGGTEKGLETGQKLLGYVGMLKHLKYLKYVPGVSWLGSAAEDISAASDSISEASEGMKNALNDAKNLLPALDLSKRKADVADALRDLNRPIVVILDDIDRLPEDEIRVVVQAIKAVADFPRTTYLLAYDRDVVAKALGKGDLVSGLSYLEKIVQVSYPIPPLFKYQLRNFLKSKLEELLVKLNIGFRPFEEEFFERSINVLTNLLRHPRDVVRFLNRVVLSLPATHSEVNSVDVLVFEAVSQRFPEIREMAHRHPEDFTGSPFRGDVDSADPFSWSEWLQLEKNNEAEPAWKKYLPEGDVDHRAVNSACEFLFPKVDKGSSEVPEDKLRIVDPDRLARYFRMSSLEIVPEAKDIHRLISHPRELAAMLSGIDDAEFQFYIEWIKNYLPSCVNPEVDGVVGAVLDEVILRDATSRLPGSLKTDIDKLIEKLLRLASSNKRTILFSKYVRLAPLSMAESILLTAAAESGKWSVRPNMKKKSGERLIDDVDAVNLSVNIWSERVEKSLEAGELYKQSNLFSILYRYAQLNDNYTEVYKMVWKICDSLDGLEKFLSYFNESDQDNIASQLGLLESSQRLAEIVSDSPLSKKYGWLTDLLMEPNLSQQVAEIAKTRKK